MKYIIIDWAGNKMNWLNNEYATYDDAFEALQIKVHELTEQEYINDYLIDIAKYDDDEFNDLLDINIGEYQIIEVKE